jgi:hypothetical protein
MTVSYSLASCRWRVASAIPVPEAPALECKLLIWMGREADELRQGCRLTQTPVRVWQSTGQTHSVKNPDAVFFTGSSLSMRRVKGATIGVQWNIARRDFSLGQNDDGESEARLRLASGMEEVHAAEVVGASCAATGTACSGAGGAAGARCSATLR